MFSSAVLSRFVDKNFFAEEANVMRYKKISICVVLIFFAATMSGCGGAIKGAVKSVGKGVAKTFTKAPKLVRGEAVDFAVDKAIDVAYDAATNDKPSTNKPAQSQPSKPVAAKVGAAVAGSAVVANEMLSDDKHWIKDSNSGALIWNPEPQEGESVRWSGKTLREGNNLYAQGFGKLEWSMDGEIFETTEGTFERGKQNGRFTHTNANGEKFYTRWEDGEPVAVERQSAPGTFNAKDLSLGELAIDDSANKVSSKLGKAISETTDSDGGRRLKFKDAEVVVKHGKISALVSMSPALSTPRGIHEGSSVREMIDKYGTGCLKTAFGEQTLYEYEITSADGHTCYLRFAVNNSNGKVDYISERLVQSESAPKQDDVVAKVDSSADAERAFINYHKAITNRNYREAYEMLSYKQRERVGSFDSYAEGYTNTISSEVSDLRLISSDSDSYTFDYTLTARDRYQGNRVKVMTFKGQVTMAKDQKDWFIRQAQSKKVNERIE